MKTLFSAVIAVEENVLVVCERLGASKCLKDKLFWLLGDKQGDWMMKTFRRILYYSYHSTKLRNEPSRIKYSQGIWDLP
jgi:hypothetical protein